MALTFDAGANADGAAQIMDTTTSARTVTNITAMPTQAQPDIHPHMGIDDTSPLAAHRRLLV